MPAQRVRVMLSSRNRYLIPAPGTGPEVGPGFTLASNHFGSVPPRAASR